MILKFCEDNFLFYITHAKYFDILCLFVILFFIVLFFLVQKDEFLKKFKNNNFKQFLIILSLGLFTGFFVFLFVWLLNVNSYNGCTTKYYENKYYKAIKNVSMKTDLIEKTKIIVVGDSRMEFIDNDKEIIKPFNLDIVAKSGAALSWFETVGLPRTKKIIDNDEYDSYFVVVNMGVNDIQYTSKYVENANTYFEDYLELSKYSPKVKLYILSVNPIIEKRLNKAQPQNVRTNDKIKKFNDVLLKKLSKEEKMYYCDSNTKLSFDADDGLHYTQDTNKKIINYIINDCIQF